MKSLRARLFAATLLALALTLALTLVIGAANCVALSCALLV